MKGAGTHPQVGARDRVWGDWLPLLRAFLPETDDIACDWPGSYIQWGLPLQHQGGGPHLKRLHIMWGTCGRWGREGVGQPGKQPDNATASQTARYRAGWSVSEPVNLSVTTRPGSACPGYSGDLASLSIMTKLDLGLK